MNNEVSTLKRRIDELEEIQKLAESLSSMVNVYQTLETIVDCCIKLCRADRGAILLFSTSVGESARTVVRNAQQERRGIDHVVNSLVAGWVGVHKKPFLTDDVLKELNFRNPSEQIRQLGAGLADQEAGRGPGAHRAADRLERDRSDAGQAGQGFDDDTVEAEHLLGSAAGVVVIQAHGSRRSEGVGRQQDE